ncbi:MAG TPA: DUF4157 domain-containing protein [Gallionella sp.]|nr:DUF4157 domain-containing protein [Gallionella sp.]
MQKAEAQHNHAQPAVRQGKGASLESPQGERIAQLEAMAESSPQAGKLAQLAVMVDSSPAMAAQRKLIGQAHGSPAMTAQSKAVNGIAQRAETPAKPNNTGLPDNLKSGIESLSGMSMDNVKVHYNSSQPAQLNALAYAQGTDIHVAPGQEQHLPHEAWHVVQQAQGRVRPTMQLKDGVPVNDDAGLEHEADVMGMKALESRNGTEGAGFSVASNQPRQLFSPKSSEFPVQRIVYFADNNGESPALAAPPQGGVVWVSPLGDVNNTLYGTSALANQAVRGLLGVGDAEPTAEAECYAGPAQNGPYFYWWDDDQAPTTVKIMPTHTQDGTNQLYRFSNTEVSVYTPVVHNHAAQIQAENSGAAWAISANPALPYVPYPNALNHYLHKPAVAGSMKLKQEVSLKLKTASSKGEDKTYAKDTFEKAAKSGVASLV